MVNTNTKKESSYLQIKRDLDKLISMVDNFGKEEEISRATSDFIFKFKRCVESSINDAISKNADGRPPLEQKRKMALLKAILVDTDYSKVEDIICKINEENLLEKYKRYTEISNLLASVIDGFYIS